MNKETLSIAGGKSNWQWAKIFGGYILVSIGAVSGSIGLLNYYKYPADEAAYLVRVIPITVLISFLFAGLGLLVRMVLDYRRRYHIERTNAMVRDLYVDRQWLQNRYETVIRTADKKAIVSGISLHTLITDRNLYNWLRSTLGDKSELNIHLLFVRPFAPIVFQKEREEKRPPGRISQDCVRNVHKALGIKRRLGAVGNRLHVHIVEGIAPIAFTLKVDDEIYFEPYLSREVGRTCPTFVLKKNDENMNVFDVFSGYLTSLIKDSDELESDDMQWAFCEITKEMNEEGRALFLDRDGVIIRDTGYVSSVDGIQMLPGVEEALKKAQEKFSLILVTNQSGVARKLFTEADVVIMNYHLVNMLAKVGINIMGVYYCPHHPSIGDEVYKKECSCRKPKSGMLDYAIRKYSIDKNVSWMIGDKESDVEAGKNAGVLTAFVGKSKDIDADIVAGDLAGIIEEILKR